tara:strand:+ start:2983 stop:3405 length:423 start_codon:yes stop_codon:yes gene_type:complete
MIKLLALLSLFINVNKSCDICGIWVEEKKESHIEIYETDNNKYEGKIIWLAEPFDINGNMKVDKKNPNKELKNRPIYNLIIIKDLVSINSVQWSHGTIYDARSGKTYRLNATLKDHNTLILKGYIGLSFIGKSTKWTRRE